jgi:hypothetical protein
VQAQATQLWIKLDAAAVEWIWVDLLGGGDRRAEERQIAAATVKLTAKGLDIEIGTGPGGYKLFRSLRGTSVGLLQDRQEAANRGELGSWAMVTLC